MGAGSYQYSGKPGSDQYQSIAGQQQANYNTLNQNFPTWAGQYASMLPNTNVLSPQFQQQLGQNTQNTYNQQLGYLNQAYGNQFRNANNNNVSRFGGLNNSLARDANGQINSYYNQAQQSLGNNMFNYQQSLQNNQLQQQQQGLGNYLNSLGLVNNFGQTALQNYGNMPNMYQQYYNPSFGQQAAAYGQMGINDISSFLGKSGNANSNVTNPNNPGSI